VNSGKRELSIIMSQIREVRNVACTQCGCVCDDITVQIKDNEIIRADRACSLAEPWFLSRTKLNSIAKINDQDATEEQAIQEAVSILAKARSPLIFGLSHSSTDAQRNAVALAETLGATIDTTASTGHAPSIVALQQVGESTCTLGEVKQRADIVVYWGCDPDHTHPRHRERYAPDKPGRTIFVVDDDSNKTRHNGPQWIPVNRSQHLEAISIMRALSKSRSKIGLSAHNKTASHNEQVNSKTAEIPEQWQEFVKRILESKFAIFFFGPGLTSEPVAHRCVEELLKWTTELNEGRRCYARRLRRSGDVAGADSVLAWQTGYPFAVNFAPGYPRSNPGEFSGPDMLARGEVDACLLIGKSTDIPEKVLDQVEQIPLIAVESPGEKHRTTPRVQLFTADYGIHRHGTAYRMDEVPIPLQPLIESNRSSDAEVIAKIHEQILAKR
jgi:formylmethanofuran dehydrogenase subunit B